MPDRDSLRPFTPVSIRSIPPTNGPTTGISHIPTFAASSASARGSLGAPKLEPDFLGGEHGLVAHRQVNQQLDLLALASLRPAEPGQGDRNFMGTC